MLIKPYEIKKKKLVAPVDVSRQKVKNSGCYFKNYGTSEIKYIYFKKVVENVANCTYNFPKI